MELDDNYIAERLEAIKNFSFGKTFSAIVDAKIELKEGNIEKATELIDFVYKQLYVFAFAGEPSESAELLRK